MSALAAAIETVKNIAMANYATEKVDGWEKQYGGLCAGWNAHSAAQQVDLIATCGTKVTVIAAIATAAGTTSGFGSVRITYKINGKRAKGSDATALTFA